MQTASQISSFSVAPPPLIKKQSNGLITASFIIGLILILPILFILVINIFGTRIQLQTGSNIIVIRELVTMIAGTIGLIGLFIGSIGSAQMMCRPGLRPYFQAIAGIVLCFAAFSYLFIGWAGSSAYLFARLIYNQ
jgi:hypothetical protein